ncbi:MAG: hypothetical protein ACLUD2_11620 [Clostridium sp.]
MKAEGGGFDETDKTHLVDIFSWEADALRQYLEQLALEGWYPESIGTIGMKCRLGEPEKRRYAAVLAPKTSVLTGVGFPGTPEIPGTL